MSILHIAASVLLLAGAGLSVLGAVGIHKFDDVLARMHAATIPATLGLLFLLAGAGLAIGDAGATMKLLLAGTLQLLTAPFGMQLLGRASYGAVPELSERMQLDDLGKAQRQTESERSDHR